MRLVVDASVAVKWLVDEEGSDRAIRLLKGGHECYVPRLLASEVGNALWRKARTGEIERGQAGAFAAAIPALAVRWMADEMVCADAVRLSLALNRALYDCVYLALAHRVGATLVTADARFVNALAGTEHAGAIAMLESLAEA